MSIEGPPGAVLVAFAYPGSSCSLTKRMVCPGSKVLVNTGSDPSEPTEEDCMQSGHTALIVFKSCM